LSKLYGWEGKRFIDVREIALITWMLLEVDMELIDFAGILEFIYKSVVQGDR